MSGLAFSPLLPTWVLLVLLAAGVAAAAMRSRIAPVGAALRLLAVLAALAFLAGPRLRVTEGEPLGDVAVVLVDESASMALGGRDEIASGTLARLVRSIEEREVAVRQGAVQGRSETALAEGLTAALGAVPRARLSAVFVVTDGQVTEVPEATSLGLGVPVHAVLAGDPTDQTDRRIRTVRAPRYGVVGESAELVFVVEDAGAETVPVTVSVGGEVVTSTQVSPGEEVTVRVPLDAPGEAVIELSVPALPSELTERNNRAAVRLTAIRDRLRVLLVSGEPHAGERVWRNTLKSDPAVDLVHFTILKPFDKDAVAPGRELNLIQFPHEELFLERLPEFDVVVFDRYTYRGVLQPYEFERVASYVRDGGALLVAAGPEFAGPNSLADQRSLAQVLPLLPLRRAVEEPFVAALSEVGARHPVTASLDEEPWGRWLRYLPSSLLDGEAVLEAPDGSPLLVLSRVGEGRVAVLASDHFWLWARGFDGGGPHRELLRRLVHWLMREPALEEEALSAAVSAGGELTVRRRTLAAQADEVVVEGPDGERFDLPLGRISEGLFEGRAAVTESGLYHLSTAGPNGTELFAVAATGEASPREYAEVLTTASHLAPLTGATGGGTAFVGSPDARLPVLRRVREGTRTSGAAFMGLVRRDAEAVTAVRTRALLPRWAWLALCLGAVSTAWLAEGRR